MELIAGGRSNLTYRLTDATGNRFVLRRPPQGHLLASAHDVAREYRIMQALSTTDVPVARPIVVCGDTTILDAPFFVAEYVEGRVVRDAVDAEKLTQASRRQAGFSLIDTLIRIHALDVDDVGLGKLGRRDDYAGRILKRWSTQHAQVRSPSKRIDALHKQLGSHVPIQGEATLVHGDYRLDNVIVDECGRAKAVLDWELATLGDPIADLGLVLVYWSQLDDSVERQSLGTATSVVGFPDRSELVEYYVRQSGRDGSRLQYFVALGFWKLACILEGVQDRYLSGSGGGDPSGASDLESTIDHVIDLAVQARSDV